MKVYYYHHDARWQNLHYYYAVENGVWRALWEDANPKGGPINFSEKRFFANDCRRVAGLYAYLRTGEK